MAQGKKSFVAGLALLLVLQVGPAIAADSNPYGATDAMSFWFDPDLAPGEASLRDAMIRIQASYVYKEATIRATADSTYFMINGSNGEHPDFYGGVQQLQDGRRVAIFSAWDVGKSNCEYFSCKPDEADLDKQVTLYDKGANVWSARFGGEGTGMQAFIYDVNWKVGEKISWLTSLEPAGKRSALSVAFRIGTEPWQYFATYLIPKRFDVGLSGGYGFIEDFGNPNTPYAARAMSVGPAILEDGVGKQYSFTSVYVGSSAGKTRHRVSVNGTEVVGEVGTLPDQDAKADYRVRIAKPTALPDYSAGKSLLNARTLSISTRAQERQIQEELERAAAAEKARVEAEERAKNDARAKAEAEEAARLAREALASKRTTITCVKGKITKRITGTNPKCPAGYKKLKK